MLNLPDSHSPETPYQLIRLLSRVEANERLSSDLYLQLMQLTGDECNSAAELCQLALHEDEIHCRAMQDAIQSLIQQTQALARRHDQPSRLITPISTQHHYSNAKQLLNKLVEIEAASIRSYQKICAMTFEYNYRIFDLSYRNMNNNTLHLQLASTLLASAR